jgi:hypothetical protein
MCYTKDRTTILDRREMLRVKIKSLAVEARIIRREEMRTFGQLRAELHSHRTKAVRLAARESHVAYGLIRGFTLDQIEPIRRTEPDMKRVEALVRKYGAVVVALKEAA